MDNDETYMKWEYAKFPMNPVYFPVALGDTIWVVDEASDGECVPVQTTVISVMASLRNRMITTSLGMILDLDKDKWFFLEKSAKVFCNNCNDRSRTKYNP